MKKFMIVLFCVLSFRAVMSQDFKISVDKIDWAEGESSTTAVLKVFYKVYNAGDVSGYCDAAIDLAVVSPFSNDVIWPYKRDDNVYERIVPGRTLYTSAFYKISKSLDSLHLAFLDEDGQPQYKFISTSYVRYQKELADNKISEYKLIADNSYTEGDYNNAIKNYLICVQYDAKRRQEFYPNLSKCYETLADISMKKFNNYEDKIYKEEALNKYNLALSYDSLNNGLRNKISKIYVEYGDSSLAHNNMTDAISNYNIAQKYYFSSVVKDKIKNLKNKQDALKKEVNEKLSFNQKFEAIVYPPTGINFNMGPSFLSSDISTKSIPFLDFDLQVPVKLYTVPSLKAPFNIFLNLQATFSMTSNTSESKFKEFYGYPKEWVIENSKDRLIMQYYLGTGVGFAFLNKYFTPVMSISGGLIGQTIQKNIVSTDSLPDIKKENSELSKVPLGFAYEFQLGAYLFKSPSLYLGFGIKNYTLNSDSQYFGRKFSSFKFSVGVANF